MKNLTEIVCVIDRSGSMGTMKSEAIQAFNSFIKEQKLHPDPAVFTLTQFDTEYEIVHSGLPLKDVPELTDKTYEPRGMTALYDSVAKTIIDVGARLAATPEADRPNKVLFIIMTDGAENASREYRNGSVVKSMIEHQQTKYGWQFVFLAAGLEAMNEAVAMGISSNNTAVYAAVGSSHLAATAGLAACTVGYRSTGQMLNVQAAVDANLGTNVSKAKDNNGS